MPSDVRLGMTVDEKQRRSASANQGVDRLPVGHRVVDDQALRFNRRATKSGKEQPICRFGRRRCPHRGGSSKTGSDRKSSGHSPGPRRHAADPRAAPGRQMASGMPSRTPITSSSAGEKFLQHRPVLDRSSLSVATKKRRSRTRRAKSPDHSLVTQLSHS
jgi:hypothetical protein